MNKRILLLTLLLFSFSAINFSFANEVTRRIRDTDSAPRALYELALFIFDKFGTNEFTIQEIADALGKTPQDIYYRVEILSRVEVLSKEKKGRENYYRFISPFDSRENVKLLSSVPELHRARYDSHQMTNELVANIIHNIGIIKEAIELAARGEFNIQLSSQLQEKFPEVRTKFLMGLIGARDNEELRNVWSIYKNFSQVKIVTTDYPLYRVDIDYDPLKNEAKILLPTYPLDYVFKDTPFEELLQIYADGMWNWLGDARFRRELVYAVILGDTKLEALLTQGESYFLSGLGINLGLSFLLHEELPFLERFIIHRNNPVIQPYYERFISLAKQVLQIRRNPVDGLSPQEKEILTLRYGLGDGVPRTLRDVVRIFEERGQEITRERVRQIEIKAIHKLKGELRFWEIAPYLNQIKEIFQLLYPILNPPP
jgi:DNA-directed RNA polymerase specialized sigma subunit